MRDKFPNWILDCKIIQDDGSIQKEIKDFVFTIDQNCDISKILNKYRKKIEIKKKKLKKYYKLQKELQPFEIEQSIIKLKERYEKKKITKERYERKLKLKNDEKEYWEKLTEEDIENEIHEELIDNELLDDELEYYTIGDRNFIIEYIKYIICYKEVQKIKQENNNKYFVWIPSSSDNPNQSHMRLYGKIFKIENGYRGKLPMEKLFCKCGMLILEKQEIEKYNKYN